MAEPLKSAGLEPPPTPAFRDARESLSGPPSAGYASEEDHFSDATEGGLPSPPPLSTTTQSTIPKTRVNRVDSTASYGEVPGTLAFDKRAMDAAPDELFIENPWTNDTSTDSPPAQHHHTPITLVSEVHSHFPHTDRPTKPHPADAEPDLVTDATIEEDRVEEKIERESGMHEDLSSPETGKQKGKGDLEVPKSPELKGVKEEDIGTANVHVPDEGEVKEKKKEEEQKVEKARRSPRLTITRDRSISEVERLDLGAPLDDSHLNPPKSPEIKGLDGEHIRSANVHVPESPPEELPKSPRLTITRDRSISEVEKLDLHAPLDDTHLEPPQSPQLEALDEFDISSTNVHEPTTEHHEIPKSPRLKVTKEPEESTKPSLTRQRSDTFRLEPPKSPELMAIDRSDIHSTNVHDPHGRPRSPSLVVTQIQDDLEPPRFPQRVDTFHLEPPRSPELDPVDEVDISMSNVHSVAGLSRSRSPSLKLPPAHEATIGLKPPASPTYDYDENVDGDNEIEEVEDDDDDFGDFDDFDDFEAAPPPAPTTAQAPIPTPQFPPLKTLEIPDFSSPHVKSLVTDLVNLLFPSSSSSSSTSDAPTPLPEDSTLFLTPRSASLWNQLVAPPPLQPPNWKQSRVRRLFLVSLGVPVDLDEILPKSKQKKLVLPSRIDTEAAGAVGKKEDGIASTTITTTTDAPAPPSTTSSTLAPHPTSSQPTPTPPFSLPHARQLASTSTAKLQGLSIAELKTHIEELKACEVGAGEVLRFWEGKRDEAIKEKVAFEGVMERLVGWARKRRAGGK